MHCVQKRASVVFVVPYVVGCRKDTCEPLSLLRLVWTQPLAPTLESRFWHDAREQRLAFFRTARRVLNPFAQRGFRQAFANAIVEFCDRVRHGSERHHGGDLFRRDENHRIPPKNHLIHHHRSNDTETVVVRRPSSLSPFFPYGVRYGSSPDVTQLSVLQAAEFGCAVSNRGLHLV